MDSTKWLAIYGALLSSFTLGWNALRDLLDRPTVKLACALGYLHNTEALTYFVASSLLAKQGLTPVGTPLFKLTITNTGRRPITITSWGAKLLVKEASSHRICIPYTLQIKLDEGDFTQETTDDLIIDERTARIFVEDGTGSNWFLPSKELGKAREQLRYLKKSADE